MELRIVLPRSHIVASSVTGPRAPPGAAGAGGSAVTGGGAESLASSWRGPFSLALGFGWGRELADGDEGRRRETEERDTLERGLFRNSYYFSSSFRYFSGRGKLTEWIRFYTGGGAFETGGGQRGCCRDKRGEGLSISCHRLAYEVWGLIHPVSVSISF